VNVPVQDQSTEEPAREPSIVPADPEEQEDHPHAPDNKGAAEGLGEEDKEEEATEAP